jgi:phosphomannomutase
LKSLPIMSVSGIRGIIDETISPQLFAEIAYVQTTTLNKGEIIVGRDTRPSGPAFAEAICRGIAAAGGKPIDIGIAPTPTVCVAVQHRRASGGIIITASHNPSQYNGYKMVHPSGRLSSGEECEAVYSGFREKKFPASTISESLKDPVPRLSVEKMDATGPHIERILGQVDVEGIRKANITIAVDSINGAAGVIFPELLSRLGVKWIGVHNKIDGDFVHNPEPRPEHLTDLGNLLKKNPGLWGGFVFDPDADRLALMGEHGEPVTEEMTLVLALSNRLAKTPSPVATNLSTSMMIDDVARKYKSRVIRTKIGEANVVSALLSQGCSIGGEGNGGVIYPAISTVRDGLTGMALILELMAERKTTLMQLVSEWQQYPMIKDKIPCDKLDPSLVIGKLTDRFKDEKTDVQDGLKIIRDEGWVHVRPSNTEPIIRCIAEAKTRENALELIEMIKSAF